MLRDQTLVPKHILFLRMGDGYYKSLLMVWVRIIDIPSGDLLPRKC